MARLFISYKREDQDVAFAVRQWLMDEQGWSEEDIFVDLDKLRAGDEWAARLFTEAETAQAMLFLASEAALHLDSFCYRELRRARGQVLAVTLGAVRPDDERLSRALPYEALARQITSLDQQPAQGFEFVSPIDGTRGVVALNRGQVENIGAVLRDLGIAPDSFDWTPDDAGPYPGLPALQEGDEAIFCGRETDIRDGLRALEELRGSVTQKVYLIQAPSGAGKSSFLRAGLWRRLRNHASFTPLVIVRAAQGIISHPEWGLVSQLSAPKANLMGLSKDAIAARVKENLGGFLAELADADAGASGRRTVLLGIDQGEEITALEGSDREEIERLLSAILSADNLDIRLVLTARDDSVDALIERLEGLGLAAGAIAMSRLNRMSPQRYRDIIRGPADAANRAGWPLDISPELEIALADGANQSRSSVGDALPLLAIALQRLVLRRRRPDGTIDLAPEDAPAFLEDAIADTVNDALKNANADVADLKTLLIPQLATWDPQAGEGGAAKRLVARDDELLTGDRAPLKPLADALVDLRLLTRTSKAGRQYHEVAHEALLRVPPMDELLYATRESYIQAQILRSEAAAWFASGAREDHLARAGDRLREAQALLADPLFGPTLAKPGSGIARYLDACRVFARSEEKRRDALRQEELTLAIERAKAESARAKAARATQLAADKVARRTRIGLAVVSVLLCVAMGAGWLAIQRASDARKQQNLAIAQREEALRQERLAQQQREAALMQEQLARASLQQAQINESRLLATLGRQELERQDYGNAIGLALMGVPQGKEDSRPLLLEPLQVLYDSMHKLKEIRTLRGHEGSVLGALKLSDGRLLSWSDDGTARLWDKRGAKGPVLRGHEGSVLRAIELSDGRILTSARDSAPRVWGNDGTAGPVLRGHEGEVSGALELSDGRLLTWGADNTARLWAFDGTEAQVLRGHEATLTGALQLSDGRLLTWALDDTARLWRADGAEGPVIRGWTRGALELSDGRLLVWGSDASILGANGSVGPWLRIAGDIVEDAYELSDGRILTQDDNAVRLWSADGTAGPILRGHGYPVVDGHSDHILGSLELSDGRLLTWSKDNTARLWGSDGTVGPVLGGHEDSINGVLELSDSRLLSWSDDGTLRFWNPDGTSGPVLRGHEGPVKGALELSNGRIMTWSNDQTVRIWSDQTLSGPVLRGHEYGFIGGLELRDGRLLSWSLDGTARLWASDGTHGPVLRGHLDSIVGGLELSDGRLLTWSWDKTVRLWNTDGSAGPVLGGHQDKVNGAIGLMGGRVLTWSDDHTARLWRSDGTFETELVGHEDYLRGGLELSDGRLLTWANDSIARLWSADGAAEKELRGHENGVLGGTELSDGRLLTWSIDGTARLWSADGAAENVLVGHEASVLTGLELSDGRLLTTSYDGTARIWGTDGSAGRLLRGHDGSVLGGLELSDGRLMTWSGDGTARLWGADGSKGPVLRGHEKIVVGGRELVDGRLLTWSWDGNARLWDADGAVGPVLQVDNKPVQGALELSDGRLITWSGNDVAQFWPIAAQGVISWAKSVNERLSPVSDEELCVLNLLSTDDCAP